MFAPADRRGALFSLYAFDIEISRIRDLAREPMPGEIRLQWWREVLEGERAGEAAANPVAASLLATLARHRLTAAKLIDLVEAHRFDIYDEPMPTLAALQSYASNTAGAIFDCAARILGEASEEIAIEAGQAQTIANVIALLPRHAARRQLFLPLDMLRQYGAEPDDVFAMRASPELRAVLAELRLRARRHLTRIAEMSADIPEKIWPAFVSLAPLAAMVERDGAHGVSTVSAARAAGLAGAVAHLAGGEIARTDRPLVTRRQPPRRCRSSDRDRRARGW